MKVTIIIFALLLSAISFNIVEAKSIWLLYEKTDVQPYPLFGHVVLDDEESNLSVEGQQAKVLERLDTLKAGKPIVTKRDDAYVMIVGIGSKGLKCTKEEGTFTQVDAALVPPVVKASGEGFKEESVKPPSIYCDLETRDKGGVKITYTIDAPPSKTTQVAVSTTDIRSEMHLNAEKDKKKEPKKDPKNDQKGAEEGEKAPPREVLVKSELRVHELYRFRVTAGPVYSSLIRRNKAFTTVTNPGGQNVISSNKDNQGPVNYPVFLKMYLWERDILEPVPFYKKFNPIVGVNLVDNPLKNFYTGLSFEPTLGVDIVAGVHWSKLKGLQPGFSEGQVMASTAAPSTKEQFFGGWFVGVTVDIGIIGSWLGNQVMKTIQGQAK